MEVLAIRTARTIAYLSTEELNPHGKAVYPALTDAVVERYGFMSFPKGLADYDEEKGIVFGMGQWNGIAIDRLTLFSNGVVVDTRSSTRDSEEIIKDGLSWVAESFGLTFKPEMMKRKGYLSELVVRCDTPLAALNPKLTRFAERLTQIASEIAEQTLNFETASLALGFDTLRTKLTLSPFRFERLVDVPYKENKFYAGAPFPTDIHVEMLNEFESLLGG